MAATVLRNSVFILGAKRTPCGAFGGTFKDVSATDLCVHSSKAVITQLGLDPTKIDNIVFGNVQQTSSDAAYFARHASLRVGMSVPSHALIVNRLCGSGFQAVITGARDIVLGESNLVLAGGVENMSQAPLTLRGARWGVKLGAKSELEDTLWTGLTDNLVKLPMGITAENLAEKYNITREDADAFGLRSQKNWAKAHAEGKFKAEIAPYTIKGKKGDVVFDTDEHPRPASTLESLAKLPPVFKKGGTVNAGNSSGICDGSASLILASEEAAKPFKPLARIVAWSYAGVPPEIMGIGPVPAVQALLKKTGLSLDAIDLVEVNEAFASQALAVAKELKLDMNKLNLNGGAIAIGHPLGMSGARILTHLAHELHARKVRYALGTACIGGGQGIAVLLERV